MANSLAAFTAFMRSKTPILAPAASPAFFRRGGGLDSGIGGDDGGGGGVHRVHCAVSAFHAGIWIDERQRFPVTGDQESTAALGFPGEMQSWIRETENYKPKEEN